MTDNEIKNKAKETSGGNYYYEQGFIYGFELGEEKSRKELEKENEQLKTELKNYQKVISLLMGTQLSNIEEVSRLINIAHYQNWEEL